MQPFSGSVFLLFTSWKSEYLNKQSQPLCPTIFSLCPHVVLGLAFMQPYSKLWKTAAHSEQAFFCSAPFFFLPSLKFSPYTVSVSTCCGTFTLTLS